MKRANAMLTMIVILMAGFMSVCTADQNCASAVVHASLHTVADSHASKVPVQQTQQDHCGMHCHITVFSLPQAVSSGPRTAILTQDRAQNTDNTISLGLYTVLDQPPRA